MKTVLIIDDSPDILYLYSFILETEGFKVLSASNGNTALKLLSQGETPNLIITDYHMVGMTGIELFSKIEKQYPKIVLDVPIVLFTALKDVDKGKFTGFIFKGLDVSDFTKLVTHFLTIGNINNENIV